MAGNVFVDEPERRQGRETIFPEESKIEVRVHTLPYVSRGGLKLEKAMKGFWRGCVEGKVCTDVGSSTGGFTDCMLQNGAVKVFAIDVGRWTVGLETSPGRAGRLYGKDEYPLCDTGRYR